MPNECTEACGWVAAMVSALCYGSFGVPVKGGPASKVNVDPLVMQSYKSAMCFLTCWLVVLLGEKFRFTTWGIVSGMFWVPGGTAGIYGIRNAGLAIAVGTWSSLVVVSSFCWGIFVFHEQVHSVFGACCAGLLLCIGLVGMSRYSSPPVALEKKEIGADAEDKTLLLTESDEDSEKDFRTTPPQSQIARKRVVPMDSPAASKPESMAIIPLEMESFVPPRKNTDSSCSMEMPATAVLLNGRLSMTRRQLGIIGAVINGTWGGTNMIPLHYASLEGFGGAGYTISFACGSALVTILMWLLRYLYHVYQTRGSFRNAYNALPSFHLREMWWPGFLSGSLYSLGNFCSIIAVTFLGQGVGYSFIQSAMLVSGLWGIFYFKEIQGTDMIAKWMLAATTAITGILWLSYEHEGEGTH